MLHNIDFSLASSEDIESALAQRIEAIRLDRNIPQARLAEQAGVSRSTMTRMAQDGKGISLDSFIRIMVALQLQDHLEALLPNPSISPLERLASQSKVRQRARTKKKPKSKWTWNDKETAG